MEFKLVHDACKSTERCTFYACKLAKQVFHQNWAVWYTVFTTFCFGNILIFEQFVRISVFFVEIAGAKSIIFNSLYALMDITSVWSVIFGR